VPVIRRASISRDLDQALNWVQSLGLDYSQSRFLRYKNELKLQEGILYLPPTAEREGSDSAYECSDLIFIHKGLSGLKSPILKRKLKALLKGPKHSSDEKPAGGSHQARDISLELVIASHFALGGFDVEFSNDADVIVRDGNTTFYIECKRPSGRNIEGTIDEIYHQLRRRYKGHKSDTQARGLAVISLTKRLIPDSETLLVNSPQEGITAISQILQSFQDDTLKLWHKNLHHQTMAVIGYVSIAISLGGRRGLMMNRQFSGRYVSRTRKTDLAEKDPDRVYFNHIVSRLNQGVLSAFASKHE